MINPMKRVSRITIHHSASRGNTTPDELYEWHTKKGFDKIGYHYYINETADLFNFGKDKRFRALNEEGAGVKGQNSENVHICLGGLGQFTVPQVWKLYDTIEVLMMNFRVSYKDIYTHNELADTECPGLRAANLVLFLYSGNLDFIRGYLR